TMLIAAIVARLAAGWVARRFAGHRFRTFEDAGPPIEHAIAVGGDQHSSLRAEEERRENRGQALRERGAHDPDREAREGSVRAFERDADPEFGESAAEDVIPRSPTIAAILVEARITPVTWHAAIGPQPPVSSRRTLPSTPTPRRALCGRV